MILEVSDKALTTPSLTIDILNKDSLANQTAAYFGHNLPPVLQPMNGDRLRGDFRNRDAIWGLRELSTFANRRSNGVALTNERLVFYVAPLGHAAGHITNYSDPVFAVPTLTIQVYDLVHNTQASINFDNFTAAANDPSRYLHLRLPEYDSAAAAFAATQGVHGLYVISLQETYNFYKRADFTDPIPELSVLNESHTQIQTIYWKGVLNALNLAPITNIELLTLCDFRKYNLPISSAVTSVAEVFDNNLAFKDFRRETKVSGTLTPVDPTTEQKETIVRDGTIGLLSTQLPLLPSDASPAPVVGLGIATAATVPLSPQSVVARSYANGVVGPAPSRLFSLNGVPPAVNTLETLNALTSNHAQLGLTLRDPLRIWETDGSTGTAAFASGAEAVGFAQIKAGGEVLSLTIGQDFPVVGDVRVVSIDLFNLYSVGATISFQMAKAEPIATVSFGLALDNEEYTWHTDPTGCARSHSLYWSDLEQVPTTTSVIYGCVAIRAIDGSVKFFRAFTCLALRNNLPGLVNTSVKQRQDGSGKIEMDYDYISAREIATGSAVVTTGGADPGAGRDVGAILPGTRKLSWPGIEPTPASLTVSSPNGSANVVFGNLAFTSTAATPYVTMSPIGDRYGENDGDDPKNQDLELESIQTIQSVSSSLDSSVSLSSSSSQKPSSSSSSQSWSESSSSSRSSNSSSSQSNGCGLCNWSLSCDTPTGEPNKPYFGRVVVHPSGSCDGQTWLYSATGLPPGVYLDPLSGQIAGTPILPGDYWPSVNVSDSPCGYQHAVSCHISIVANSSSSSSHSSKSSLSSSGSSSSPSSKPSSL